MASNLDLDRGGKYISPPQTNFCHLIFSHTNYVHKMNYNSYNFKL